MHILCLGVNHNTAPLALRERLAFDPARTRATLARFGFGRASDGPIADLAILSTCNRVETYAYASQPDFAPLHALLAEATGVPAAEIAGHAYCLADMDAVSHLFRVAAGLESMVLGEPQILGQVAEALNLALRAGSSGLVLSRLFQGAIHVGKRARHETDIAVNPANVSTVAVHLVASIVPELKAAHVAVIGAGEMAELAVEALRKRSVRMITLVNRSLANGQELARRWQAQVRPFGALPETLGQADVVISSTGAPHAVIHLETVQEAMAARPGRPLVIVDLAVPRDVESSVDELPEVHVYDLDRLHAHLSQSVDERRAQVPAVERILEEEIQAFAGWLRSLAVRPLIRALRQQAEAIRRSEVERTLRRANGRSAHHREELDALTRALVNKLLHAPTSLLIEKSQDAEGAQFALAARLLFDLGPIDGTDGASR
ncbi:MAG TPA: glutamyl-tRNA reductase [Anaerolineales bacterium]|nr:glutamyl-tRNA reductase [Anaerolineales bacterium]